MDDVLLVTSVAMYRSHTNAGRPQMPFTCGQGGHCCQMTDREGTVLSGDGRGGHRAVR